MNAITLPPPLLAAPTRIDGDEPLFEIVDGQRVEISHMSQYSSRVASRLLGFLFLQVRDVGHPVMETVFHLALPIDRNRRPDVAFVSYKRWPKDRPDEDKDENAWDVVPELAVEVVSPHDNIDEMMTKIGEYFQSGIQLVWIVHPKLSLIYVYESLTQVRGLTRADVLDGGAVLPGFRLPLSELFSEA